MGGCNQTELATNFVEVGVGDDMYLLSFQRLGRREKKREN